MSEHFRPWRERKRKHKSREYQEFADLKHKVYRHLDVVAREDGRGKIAFETSPPEDEMEP